MKKLSFVKSRVWCGEEARIYKKIGEAFAGLLVVDTTDINGKPTVYMYSWSIDTMWTADTPPIHAFHRPGGLEIGRKDPFEMALDHFGYKVIQ